MGKTCVFVLAVLQQLEPKDGEIDTLVICHTRELAYQICQEFLRFSKYLKEVKIKVFFGGIAIRQHRKLLTEDAPHVVIGTPGRVLQLVKEKQVMMFSATMAKDIRPVARKFTQNPTEIYVDDESKLTLHGLQQYYVNLTEAQKNRKLNDLLD